MSIEQILKDNGASFEEEEDLKRNYSELSLEELKSRVKIHIRLNTNDEHECSIKLAQHILPLIINGAVNKHVWFDATKVPHEIAQRTMERIVKELLDTSEFEAILMKKGKALGEQQRRISAGRKGIKHRNKKGVETTIETVTKTTTKVY